MGCSCQRRVASNGVSVCSSCITTYEAGLNSKNPQPPKPNGSTAPTNVNVFYKAP
jgi:hypothetical protein